MSGVDWGEVALLVGVVVPSVILHEVSHGVTALRFGDDTAKRAGRLTLNPLVHIDPFGTVLLPLVLALSGVGVIGYAKPVPVNLRRLRKPRDQAVLVALAGPATNIAIALVAAAVVHLNGGYDIEVVDDHIRVGDVGGVAYLAGALNVLLALFNLVPVPPLDGSAVLERFIPRRWWPAWAKVRRYSVGVLLVAVVVFGLGQYVVDPAFALFKLLV